MRVIGAEGEQVGILSRDEALAMAQEAGLDLVEIQPNGDPPVCRIMDFGKFKCGHAFKSHILTKKATKRKRGLRATNHVRKEDAGRVARMLPYA